VLFHGYGGNSRWWARNLAPLASRYTVYALDLPDFGASRMAGRYTFRRTIDGIATWIEAQHLGPAAIVGHSMGGHLALLLAARHPVHVRALVLIAPSGLPLERTLLGLARDAFLSRAAGDMRFTPIVVGGVLRADPRALWQAVREIQRIDVRPHLADLAVPTLILWGDQDRLLPVANARVLSAAIPGAQVRIVQGGTHNIFFDQADLMNEAIVGFLGTPASDAGSQAGQ